MITALLDPFTRVLGALRRWAHHLHARLAHAAALLRGELDRAWSRHTRRLAADPPYRRALTVALAAVATTLLPHPAIAAALGAWLAEPAHRPAPRWTDDDPDDEDDPPWRGPRRWDSLG